MSSSETTADGPRASLDDRLATIWERAARAGRSLPGEPTLAATLSSSRPAVREALIRLEERGYIHRRKGAETTVNSTLLDVPARFDRRLEQFDLIAAMGRTPSVEVVHHELSRIRISEAVEYDLPPSVTVFRTTKLWRADGEPVLLARDNVPVTAPSDPDGLDASASMVDVARELTGEQVEWEMVWPSAENLTREDAVLVGREPGEAELSLDVTGVSRLGRICYWTLELHLRGAFRYAMVRRAEWH